MALIHNPSPALSSYSLQEKIGTGATMPCTAYGRVTDLKTTIVEWLMFRAAHWNRNGYEIEWHDNGQWFVAKRPGYRTIYVTLWEFQFTS